MYCLLFTMQEWSQKLAKVSFSFSNTKMILFAHNFLLLMLQYLFVEVFWIINQFVLIFDLIDQYHSIDFQRNWLDFVDQFWPQLKSIVKVDLITKRLINYWFCFIFSFSFSVSRMKRIMNNVGNKKLFKR